MSTGFKVQPAPAPEPPAVLAPAGAPRCREKHPPQGHPCDRLPGHDGGHLNKVSGQYWQAS